jgi:hypothetical protein
VVTPCLEEQIGQTPPGWSYQWVIVAEQRKKCEQRLACAVIAE